MIGSVHGIRKKDLGIGFSELDSWFVGEKEPGNCSFALLSRAKWQSLSSVRCLTKVSIGVKPPSCSDLCFCL
jgi:hypothetical protein